MISHKTCTRDEYTITDETERSDDKSPVIQMRVANNPQNTIDPWQQESSKVLSLTALVVILHLITG